MNFKNIKFLANANIKGNQKSTIICVLMLILVISLILIPSLSVTITEAVYQYKEDYRARSLELDPWDTLLTEDVIESVKQIEHVESVSMLKGMRDQGFNLIKINDCLDSNLQSKINNEDASFQAWSLIGNEKRKVIAGKSLDETPTFSCIVPSLFYPFDTGESESNINYIDGERLIGSTITIKPFGDHFELLYNFCDNIYNSGTDLIYLPAVEYKLKIVGVYYSGPTSGGYYSDIYVSEETGQEIVQMAFEESEIDMTDESNLIVKWWNTPELRTHYVNVDDYDNIDYVYDEISKIGISIANDSEMGINPSIPIIANLFSVGGIILIIATLLLCLINIIQSTTSSLQSRKGEIGLLKAIGYKNKQIFSCLYFEQLSLTIKGCAIGAVISAVGIAISNFIFSHSTYVNRLYIVNWSYYLIFLAIAVAVAIVIPLICQLLTLHKLNKIQPKDAMNE